MLKGSAWSLNYKKCTPAELRKFIEDRTGATLSEEERQTIRNCNLSQLVNRLHKLDRASTFPRFMELPQELRDLVYEELLVDTRERDEHGNVSSRNSAKTTFKLYPALLQTSELIHSEAHRVLYRKNTFRATVVDCVLSVARPGSRNPFYQTTPSGNIAPYLSKMFEDHTMDMLRSLTHLSIGLSVVVLGEHERDEYVPRARNAVACLCLALTGASKMKELTINVKSGHPKRSKADFPRILWPLVLLRTEIVIKFEGIAELLEASLTDPKTVPHAEVFYGMHIAQIRQRCDGEIGKHGSDFEGLYDIGVALAKMNFFGDHLIRINDIVNLSAAWTGMRSEADRIEASRLGA